MRTQKEIKKQICDTFIANSTIQKIYGLLENKTFEQEFSKVSFENILFETVAYAIYFLEQLFDLHLLQVKNSIDMLKPHSARWYHTKAMAFQYGFDLLQNTDIYDNANYTDEQINDSKIIKYAAVSEVLAPTRLILKIATEKDGSLTKLSDEQALSFSTYINEVKDAGVLIVPINFAPDKLKLDIKIIRDKLVLKSDGQHIINGNYPVNDTLQHFIRNLPFDGELSLQKLVDDLQSTQGVIDLAITSAKTAWIDADNESGNYGNYENIDIRVNPKSGYFIINLEDENSDKSNINYV